MANESDEESENSPANSYTRAFSNRGPNKRKIKPSLQSQLLQFAMFSDSEDDEDFVANSDDDDYSTDHSREGGNDANSSDEKSEVGPSPKKKEVESALVKKEESIEVEDDEESDDEDFEPVSNGSEKSSDESEEGNEEATEARQQPDESEDVKTTKGSATTVDVSTKPKKPDRLVCGVCLETESTEEDELVECDWCGITVHEGCYGDAEESVSETKSESDAETEPWFCDACKAKCEGYCELCPVKGGILKQTDSGQWVHLICALYVPGVGFRDVDRLQSIVLDDISSSRWSSRRCVLCEDQRFSKTGVCIECDAGMCKTYFHALCAQKHGLLTEVPAAGHLDDDDADPLFAHCKLHTDKTLIKARTKRWTSFETHSNSFKPLTDLDEKARIEEAYERARRDYIDFRKDLSPAVSQTIDEPRLLTSCPEVCNKLLQKANIMGYSTHSQEVAMNITAYIRAFKPALSCDFVNHFFKRETLVSRYEAEEEPLQQKIEKNKEEQKHLRENFSKLKSDLEESKSNRADLLSKATKLNLALEKILGKKIALPSHFTKPKRKQRKESETNIDLLIHTCETCKGMENQHLMALCDTCHNYYHIGCLDPPLSALPKKGQKWLWQCTECDKSDSSEESVDEESGPSSRKRKRKTNAPQKFTPSDEKYADKKGKGRKSLGKIGKTNKKHKELTTSQPEDADTITVQKVTAKAESNPKEKSKRGKKRKPETVLDPCFVCSKDGDNKNMVQCDECSHCYHFDCCEPKLRGNPKKRGYMWFCNDCGESDEDEDVDADAIDAIDAEGCGSIDRERVEGSQDARARQETAVEKQCEKLTDNNVLTVPNENGVKV